MYLNTLKVLQKVTLIALGILLGLIVIENLQFQFKNYKTGEENVAKIKQEINSVTAKQLQKSKSEENSQTTAEDSRLAEATAIALWWTPFIGEMEYTKDCGDSVCFFTGNHKYFTHEKLKSLLFYGSNLEVENMPIPRLPKHVWALYHEESPKNVPLLMYQQALQLFNLTATFNRNSDFPLTLQYLETYEKLVDKQYFISVEEKNRLQSEEGLAPVLFIQSICDTLSGRDDYVASLMKHIRVDSYGKCLNNNKSLPKSLTGDDYLSTIQTEEFYKFIARYKFVIAYENSACDDYITEKIWRPLMLGIVPIYFGASNIQNWLPNKESAVLINQFKSPKHLADHLMLLNNNDAKYNRLLAHKIHQNVTNKVLRQQLEHRGYETNSIVEDFECFVCQRSIKMLNKPNAEDTTQKQISDTCGDHLLYPKMAMEPQNQSSWQSIFHQGKCEAITLNELLQQNKPFNKSQFQELLISKYKTHLC